MSNKESCPWLSPKHLFPRDIPPSHMDGKLQVDLT